MVPVWLDSGCSHSVRAWPLLGSVTLFMLSVALPFILGINAVSVFAYNSQRAFSTNVYKLLLVIQCTQ